MTVEEIKNIIENAEFEYIGIRADSRDYKVGEVMDNSHQIFQDADCGGELVKEDHMQDSTTQENLMEHAL